MPPPMRLGSKALFLLLLSVPLLGLSLGLALHMYGVGRVARSTERWQVTEGIVASEPAAVGGRWIPPGYRWVSLTYQYSAGSGGHRNDRIWSDGRTAPTATAEALVRQLRAGDTLRVFYDPERPTSSLLFAGEARGPFAPGSLWGVLCAAVPLLLALRLLLAAYRASGPNR